MSGNSDSKPALVIEICVKSVTEFNDDVPLLARAILLQRDRKDEKQLPLNHRLAQAFADTEPTNVIVVGNEMPMIYDVESDDEDEPLCGREFHKWSGMWRCITEKLFLRGDNNGWTRLTFWTLVRMQPN